ncbi:MAG: Flp family type IVb pilin [Nitrosomonas sp.]|nr:Flp family type IVb pilin [Nitrosomonas sp.]MCW5600864.1 Flp family type IVb pilin [Nitrosomonas sp.]
MNKLVQAVKRFMNDEQGMGAVEYALIVALMAAAIVAGWPTLTSAIEGAFTAVSGHLSGT